MMPRNTRFFINLSEPEITLISSIVLNIESIVFHKESTDIHIYSIVFKKYEPAILIKKNRVLVSTHAFT